MNLEYFISYFLLLAFGAMIITGFFNITRGNYKTLPDGTKEKEGMILRDWYFFWFKEKNPKIYTYSERQLEGVIAKLKQAGCNFGIESMEKNYFKVNSMPDMRSLQQYALMLEIRIDVFPPVVPGDFMEIYIRKEEKQYVYSWWLRKMMAGCIPCHSSWLGSIIYWIAYAFLNHANNSAVLVFLTWIAYCLSLAYLSPRLWKQIN